MVYNIGLEHRHNLLKNLPLLKANVDRSEPSAKKETLHDDACFLKRTRSFVEGYNAICKITTPMEVLAKLCSSTNMESLIVSYPQFSAQK